MEISLTSSAYEYVLRHGKSFMLVRGFQAGCCGARDCCSSGMNRRFHAVLGVPKDPQMYRQVFVDDCVSWVPKDQECTKIEVDIVKRWLIERLVVKSKDGQGGACCEQG